MTTHVAKKVRGVLKCSRCGLDHAELQAFQFRRPIAFDNGSYEYWAMCPTWAEPLIISVQLIEDADWPSQAGRCEDGDCVKWCGKC